MAVLLGKQRFLGLVPKRGMGARGNKGAMDNAIRSRGTIFTAPGFCHNSGHPATCKVVGPHSGPYGRGAIP